MDGRLVGNIGVLAAIIEAGSFARAADTLGLSPSGVSRAMARLEARIGVRLLDRTTRSTALSPMGRDFLPLARRIVDDLVHGLDRLRTSSRLGVGDVTVATLQSVAFRQLPLALRSYARKYPDNRIHLLERSGALVTEAVHQSQADFGIHIQQDSHPDLTEDMLMRDPFVLVCSRSHPAAKLRKVTWANLKGIDLITLGGASGNRRIVETQLTKAGLNIRGRFVVESTPSAIALARENVGAAILPAWDGENRRCGNRDGYGCVPFCGSLADYGTGRSVFAAGKFRNHSIGESPARRANLFPLEI